MNFLKIFVVIVVLGGGIAGSYFIFQNSLPALTLQSSHAPSFISTSTIGDPVQWAKDVFSARVGALQASSSPALSAVPFPRDNFTEMLGNILLQEIGDRNNNGLTEKNGVPALSVPDKDVISDALLAQLSGNVSLALTPEIDESRLRITRDVSPASHLLYFKTILSINQQYIRAFHFDTPAVLVLQEIYEKGDARLAAQSAEAYRLLLQDYYVTRVPLTLLELHTSFITYYYANTIVYSALRDFKTDPLKAYLALQEIGKLAASARDLQLLLGRVVANNNIDLSAL